MKKWIMPGGATTWPHSQCATTPCIHDDPPEPDKLTEGMADIADVIERRSADAMFSKPDGGASQ